MLILKGTTPLPIVLAPQFRMNLHEATAVGLFQNPESDRKERFADNPIIGFLKQAEAGARGLWKPVVPQVRGQPVQPVPNPLVLVRRFRSS